MYFNKISVLTIGLNDSIFALDTKYLIIIWILLEELQDLNEEIVLDFGFILFLIFKKFKCLFESK